MLENGRTSTKLSGADFNFQNESLNENEEFIYKPKVAEDTYIALLHKSTLIFTYFFGFHFSHNKHVNTNTLGYNMYLI